ncbi:MAG: hypothetical protein ABI607_00670 [Betaproteobacteria bacterium]
MPLLSVVLAFSFNVAAQSSDTTNFKHEIKPGKIEEECRAVTAGTKVDYRFSASAPVAFNVHFHKGNAVEYPVKVELTIGERGTFTAPSREEFCWMWTNSSKGNVIVEGNLIEMR